MCFKPSDKPVTRLKKIVLRYLFSIFKFRYVCQQVNQMNLASCTNFVRRFSLIFIFWFNDCKWIRTTCSPFAKTTVPNSLSANLLENTSREFREKLEVLMSHFP